MPPEKRIIMSRWRYDVGSGATVTVLRIRTMVVRSEEQTQRRTRFATTQMEKFQKWYFFFPDFWIADCGSPYGMESLKYLLL